MTIGKKEQRILKGIAIICMMMLHFWAHPEWLLRENMYQRGVFPEEVYIFLGSFGNVCVSIFAFLTGYSFFALSDKWGNLRYRINKIIRFILEYWVYVVIFLFVGIILKNSMPTLGIFILNLFGIEVGIGRAWINVPFAWYVSAYITFVLVYPMIRWLFSRTVIHDVFIIFVFYYIIKALAFFSQDCFGLGYYFGRINVLLVLMVGYLAAKYDVFSVVEKLRLRNRRMFYFANACIIGLLVILKLYCNDLLVLWWGAIYTLYITYFVLHGWFGRIIVGASLEKLGEYSMGMWFISGLFFLDSKLQFAAFFLKRPVLILFWVILICYAASYIITNLIVRVKQIIWKG